jgi:hypothetical protein
MCPAPYVRITCLSSAKEGELGARPTVHPIVFLIAEVGLTHSRNQAGNPQLSHLRIPLPQCTFAKFELTIARFLKLDAGYNAL